MGLNDNTLNKQNTQKRILIATVLSFAFFIAYDFLYLKPQQEAMQAANAKKQLQMQQNVKTNENSAPATTSNAAPQIQTTEQANQAPVSNSATTTKIISVIRTKHNLFKIDNLGRIAQVTLEDKQYVDKNNKQINLFAENQLRPLEVRFADTATNNEAFKVNVVASSSSVDATNMIQKLTLTQKLSNTTLTKILTFYPDGHYDLNVYSTNKYKFFITPGYRPDVIADMYADHGGLLSMNDGTLNVIKDEKLDKNKEFVGVSMVSAFDRYYATVLYNYKKNMAVSAMKDATDSPNLFIHAQDGIQLHGYIGPKDHRTLSALNPKLTDVIEYGWFTFIAKPMFYFLQYIHTYVGNWGWTIFITTILIKLILFPLSHKGMTSMNRLKELAPKIKAIQEKYADDKQKASMHMMELYKKEGANPMGGCLPLILQIPVFFAIYRVLLNAIELKGAPWILWIHDLAEMDPYFVLPILMGITMFLQQRITPNTMQDEMQRKIFQMLPVIFTFFFLWFPAGLTLYWFTNNLFTIIHQFYLNKVFEKAKLERHEKHIEEKQAHKLKKKK